MAAAVKQIFFPVTLQELFGIWSKFPDSVPCAGGTRTFGLQGGKAPVSPKNLISLNKLPDLRRISRTERYLEIGAMINLSEIISLGKIVPGVLTRCLEGIANPQLRNLITIGGNICTTDRRLDASAPMIALDALYELRSAQSSRWISAARFASLPGALAFAPQELLTRIRVPLEQWNYTRYKKFGADNENEPGGIIVFILKNQKNILTDLQIVFAGDYILRDKNSESGLEGKGLPLDFKDIQIFMEHWKTYLGAAEHSVGDLLQKKILNFIETSMLNLTD
jgi:CO/xanthine dehydrogenase FAD-binding subunit